MIVFILGLCVLLAIFVIKNIKNENQRFRHRQSLEINIERLSFDGEHEETEEFSDDNGNNNYFSTNYLSKVIPSHLLKPKELIDSIDNYFARKKIVLTGDLDNFPDRKDLAQILYDLGADLDTGISQRINIVIAGNDPGWTKMPTAIDYQNEGFPLKIIYEDEFMAILSKELDKINNPDLKTLLQNSVITLTGEFDYFTSSNLKLAIMDRSGTVKALTKKTTILLVGSNPNPQILSKANEMNSKNIANINITNEKDFLETIFPDQSFHFDTPLPRHPFNGQIVVISGVFKKYSREDIKKIVILLGGTVASTFGKKVNCLIKGDNIGPTKQAKLDEMISKGLDINVITEIDLVKIINNVTKNYHVTY